MNLYDEGFDFIERKTIEAPDHYQSVEAAIEAVIKFAQDRMTFNQTPINWQAFENSLTQGLENLCLSGAKYASLYDALKSIGYSANTSRTQVVDYGLARWETLKDAIRTLATGHISRHNSGVHCTQFRNVIEDFPPLADDKKIFEQLIDLIESRHTNLETLIHQMRALNGDETRAVRVLRAIGAAGYRCADHQFALLCAQWAGTSAYGKLQFALWYAPAQPDREQVVCDVTISKKIEKLASLLFEFGVGSKTGQNHYNLHGLNSAMKTSWREEVSAVVEGDKALATATLETLFVMGPAGEEDELLSVAIKLADKKTQDELSTFVGTETTLANRRARACISLLRENPDVLDLMLVSYQPIAPRTVAGADQVPRTWLDNPRIEQLFEAAVNDMARRAGGEIFDNLHAGEETHVGEFFKDLKYCLETLSRQLAFAAKELDAHERFDFSLSQRIIGKPEEGGEGVDYDRFSTDICLIFKAMDEGVCLTERVTLIQAKRLQIISDRRHVYSLKRDQLNDIAMQTLASFLLLLGPAQGGRCLPVISASLMVDLMKQNKTMSLSPSRAAGLGKSFGTWLLEDVIGLWTGDKSEKLVKKANGQENGRPRLIYEFLVQRSLTSFED
ncbi:hypothetical protein [Pseudomonas lactis]|nr:hypothetical protein [Pseudomonas lactis]KRP76526.1 hypothetical protein TX24_23285 [Pseudomonas lactis]